MDMAKEGIKEGGTGERLPVVVLEDAVPRKRGRRDSTEGNAVVPLGWSGEIGEIYRCFGRLISSEKEKKKVAMATLTELEGIRDKMMGAFELMREENCRLEGRLAENRRQLDVVMRNAMARAEVLESESGLDVGAVEIMEGVEEGGDKNAKRKKDRRDGDQQEKGITQKKMKTGPKGEANKKGSGSEGNREERSGVEINRRAVKENGSEEEVAMGGNKETTTEGDGFTVVGKKKGRGIEKKILGMSKGVINAWKEREPLKSFVVTAGEGGALEAKKGIWAEVVKRVGIPKINKTWVNGKGELRLTPGDSRTAEALREIRKEGKIEVREVERDWPKVLIYDVERDMAKEDIGRSLRSLNPELGMRDSADGREDVIPIFRKGSRVGTSVGWVCAVRPGIFNKLTGGYVYIGMARCRVKDYVDFMQCRGCQGFGHLQAKCKRGRIICGYCAKEGHRDGECPDRKGKPKCFNCKGEAPAWHNDCQVRRREMMKRVVGTQYAEAK